MARKLQLDEEEESKFRRDVSDLSRRLAIEAKDRELALALQEKEKARLRKAKEKARLKAQQRAASQHETRLSPTNNDSHPRHTHVGTFIPAPSENIAACIDPTWGRRQQHVENRFPVPVEVAHLPASIPITDLGMIYLLISP